MNIRMHIIAFLSILSFTHTANAEQTFSADYLIGEGDLDGIRVAFRPYEKTVENSQIFGLFDVSIESSISYLKFDGVDENESNVLVAVSPVITKEIATFLGKPLKVELGVGLAYVRDTRYDRKDLGSHYQFEDRVGLVYNLNSTGNQAIALRYFHYSNGGLKTPNPGLDFLNLSYFHYF